MVDNSELAGKKRGVYTLPPYAGWTNQQLTKNCGIVPYLLMKRYGFHAVMAGAKIDKEYPYIKYVRGMDIEFLPDGEMSTKISYVKSHINDIDLLILHGYNPYYVELVECYRELRPDGKIYMELDENLQNADRTGWYEENERKILDNCDVIGCSCRSLQKYLSKKIPYIIDYLPNGFCNFDGIDFTPDFSTKEKVILTVGRIGIYEKNNELLLEAFANIAENFPEWTVRLVGKISEKNFQIYLEQYFIRFPHLRNRVILTGEITNRNELAKEYQKASIFALTSRKEGGTPNVIAEALAAGCYIVTSSIDAAEDATDCGKCGDVFQNENTLALITVFRNLLNNQSKIQQGGHHALTYVKETFNFEKIVDRLYYLLYGECER